jgi:hypothetical protein
VVFLIKAPPPELAGAPKTRLKKAADGQPTLEEIDFDLLEGQELEELHPVDEFGLDHEKDENNDSKG